MKGKYKRKRERARQKAKEAAQHEPVMEPEKATNDAQQQAPAPPVIKIPKDKKPSRWTRIKEWAKKEKTFTDWCIAGFTAALAGAAVYQFLIMGGQLHVMRVDQRAWLWIRQTSEFAPVANNALTLNLQIQNTGKTPAAPIQASFYIDVVPRDQSPPFEAGNVMHRSISLGMLPPTGASDVPISRLDNAAAPKSIPLPLTEAEYSDLMDGKSYVAAWGKVVYLDVFGTNHWTKFCVWKDFKPGDYYARACTGYNDIDHNK